MMKSQVAGYKKCVVPNLFYKFVGLSPCAFLLNYDHICEPQK